MHRHQYQQRLDDPYGPLDVTDVDGIALPPGFGCRVIARSGSLTGSTYWHPAPDDGACFADGDGWIYVSNSRLPLAGGASAIRFAPGGEVRDAYRVLDGTSLNSAGLPTPWGSWLSCEEMILGRVHEVDPRGERPARARGAMGRFKHGAIAFDADRGVLYLTEAEVDGCFYRFTPHVWGDLSYGRLEVLCRSTIGVEWRPVPEPAPGFLDAATREQVSGALRFDGGADCHYVDDVCYFATGDEVAVWAYDCRENTLRPGGDRLGAAANVHIVNEGHAIRIDVTTGGRAPAPVVRVDGHRDSTITGAAFSPDGTRLYFSSQRGAAGSCAGGVTYEVTGPFGR